MSNSNVPGKKIKKIISRMKNQTILVIGDIMLDEYVWGEVKRISPEAPVPVVDVESSTCRLGGAANVVQNLGSLGVKTLLLTVCGSDANSKTLRKMLKNAKCRTDGVFSSKSRITTTKTRIMAKQQQIVRADREVCNDLGAGDLKKLLSWFDTEVKNIGGVIISDYGKGVVCRPLINHIINKCRENGIFTAIDPKERHFDLYEGVDIITPNLRETLTALGKPYAGYSDEEIRSFGWKLADTLKLNYLLVTLSDKGMALYQRRNHKYTHLPTVAQKVFDVTGAGDTVISVFTAAFISGATPLEAAYLANHAAGITIGELGTSSVTGQQLLNACLK